MLRAVCAGFLFLLSSAAWAGQAIVTFTFDDAPRSVFTVGLPILAKYDIPATLYIATKNVGLLEYMNWDEIAEAVEHGWEVGAHTHTHRALTTLSDTEIVEELFISMSLLAGQGYRPEHFSSPLGGYDERVLSILRMVYRSHRTGWPRGINTGALDPYRIASYYLTRDTTWEEVEALFASLRNNGGWLVFQLHHITSLGETVEHEYDTDLLERIVEQVYAEGFTTLTLGEALQQLQKGD